MRVIRIRGVETPLCNAAGIGRHVVRFPYDIQRRACPDDVASRQQDREAAMYVQALRLKIAAPFSLYSGFELPVTRKLWWPFCFVIW